jgi:hypothetical protein
VLSHKKLYRLYREERLMVRKRSGHKRAIRTKAPMALPEGPNCSGSGAVRQIWRVEEERISGSSSRGGDRDQREIQVRQFRVGAGRQEHPSGDPQAVFG